MRGTILQPTYLPWLGYFEMISSTDVFVVFDHVQFVKKSWQQRNQIKTSNGITLLTVPIKKASQKIRICDVEISYENTNALKKHWTTISLAYGKAKYFKDYSLAFQEIYSTEWTYLRDLNVALIKKICEFLKINTTIIFSSELELTETDDKTENIVTLCKKVGIDYLYDAQSAESFINKSLFTDSHINIEFQKYHHPIYSQLWGNFVPQMSVIDLLFNEGNDSIQIIKNGIKQK